MALKGEMIMCNTKCIGHWNLVAEVGLPEPDRDVVFTYINGANNHKMVDVGAYFTKDLIDGTFDKNEAGFYSSQLDHGALGYSLWFEYICSPKNVIAWYYLEPYKE